MWHRQPSPVVEDPHLRRLPALLLVILVFRDSHLLDRVLQSVLRLQGHPWERDYCRFAKCKPTYLMSVMMSKQRWDGIYLAKCQELLLHTS